MLPNTYSFMVSYKGGSKNMSQNIGENPVVEFKTVPVTVILKDPRGIIINNNATSAYYDGGYQPIGPTGTSIELLPTTYSFQVTYNGGASVKAQNVSDNPVVEFSTVPVTVVLKDSIGLPLKGDAWYYWSGWKKVGDGKTPSKMEMLPGKYSFKVDYDGVSNEMAQEITANSKVVEFRTSLVTVNLVTKVKVMGLTFKLPVVGGKVSYYANYAAGWKDMCRTPLALKQLLPATYQFAVEFMGQRQQVSRAVTGNTTVEFEIPSELYYKALKEALS